MNTRRTVGAVVAVIVPRPDLTPSSTSATPTRRLGTLEAVGSNGGLALSGLVRLGLLVVVSRSGTAASTATNGS